MSKNVIPDEENFLTNFEPVGKTPSSEAQLKVVEQQGRSGRGDGPDTDPSAKPKRAVSPRASRPDTSPRVEEPTEKADRRSRQTLHIRESVMDRARNCVYWLEGPPERLTLGELAERGLLTEAKRLERMHNDGKPFPPREAGLRGGRRVSVD